MDGCIETIKIGKTVSEVIRNDNKHEAILTYNAAIKFAREIDDQGATDLPIKILKMKICHLVRAKIRQYIL